MVNLMNAPVSAKAKDSSSLYDNYQAGILWISHSGAIGEMMLQFGISMVSPT